MVSKKFQRGFHVTCAQQRGLLCEEGGINRNVKYCGYCEHHVRKAVGLQSFLAFWSIFFISSETRTIVLFITNPLRRVLSKLLLRSSFHFSGQKSMELARGVKGSSSSRGKGDLSIANSASVCFSFHSPLRLALSSLHISPFVFVSLAALSPRHFAGLLPAYIDLTSAGGLSRSSLMPARERERERDAFERSREKKSEKEGFCPVQELCGAAAAV